MKIINMWYNNKSVFTWVRKSEKISNVKEAKLSTSKILFIMLYV